MGLVEREQVGGVRLYEASNHRTVAALDTLGDLTTVTWSSRLPLGQALDKFLVLLGDLDPRYEPELLTILTNGNSRRIAGDFPDCLEEIRHRADTIALLRLDVVSKSLGPLSLEYRTSVPGLSLEVGAISVTSSEIAAKCIETLIEDSASKSVVADIARLATQGAKA
jgi:hypothetical protein